MVKAADGVTLGVFFPVDKFWAFVAAIIFCAVEVTNKLWDAVMGFRPEGQSNNGDAALGFRIVLR